MLNSCEFIGNLGADPETRLFQNGGKVCNLRLAVTEKWKDRDGNPQEATEWITVAIFNEGLVGVAERFLKKGSKIYVRGAWKTRKYQTQDGSDRYSTECVLRGFDSKLVMLDGASGSGGGNRDTSNRGDGSGDWNTGSQGGGSNYDNLDDDIPF